MASLKLNAELRDGTGKGVARKLRRSGRIPAVLYGQGMEGTALSLNADDLTYLIAKGHATTSILRLEIQEGKDSFERNVLIKELQRHPYRDAIYHVDLQEIALDQDITIKVPVETTGESEGVKMGGILEFKRRELEVTCLPGKIPDSLVIDISELQIGDVVHVADLSPPEGVTIPHDVNFTIITVVAPRVEEEAVEEVEEEEALAEPEVIGKGKEQEEPEEKEEIQEG
ncbi:MAG: 50S ribosomal protein L25/general stress protein Ctc [bacterium]|nr:MAG: 50S ribosomal protein L25/general stress protein Ctc [bacterium]